ncbi:MAG: hypothetical protein IT385_17395, partial [Deltaproteobacteria bacterium]|nr:hypothetical protein [Deltaproteobacteria bacterium]
PEDPRGLIGPKPEDPRGLIGPKPEDPRGLIGPKPEDPRALGLRLIALARELSLEERAALDWLVARGERASARPGTPGGLPPGLTISLGQALGVHAIGPKQDDPVRPPKSRRFQVTLTEDALRPTR